MAALIDLCNRALASIAKGQIASLAEGSLESRECQQFAQSLLNEMADWSDILPIGQARVALALLLNDRPAEWNYCYAAPAGMSQAIAIRTVQDAANPLPLAGPYNFPTQQAVPIAFLYEAGKIYTNVEYAMLIYSLDTITPADLSPLMQQAFCDELAARIAMPLAKDAKLVESRMAIARASRDRAVADEENKVERRQPRYVSEAEYARMGIGL